MIRGLVKAPLALLLLTTFTLSSQISSASPQAVTINEAEAALLKAKSKLDDANILYKRKLNTLKQERESLLKIAAEKDQVTLTDNSNPFSEQAGKTKLTEHLYKEKQAKVERLEKRANSAKSKVFNARREVSNLQLELSNIRKRQASANRNRPAGKATKPKKTASKNSIKVAKLNKPNKQLSPANTKPLDDIEASIATNKSGNWPHLSAATSNDRRYAKAALEKLERRGKWQKAPFETITVTAKSSFGSKKMRYLGDDIYSLSTTVRSGYQSFEVFDKQHWFDIPASDNAAVYRVLYDITSLSDPKIYLFNEALVR